MATKIDEELACAPAPVSDHPFLSGIHRPMAAEHTITDLAVDGTIPTALDGCYLRIGPNPIAPDPANYHWFSGDGMVHGLKLANGRAHWYRNRWIRSERVGEALGVPKAPGPRNLFDTVNTNVLAIGGQTYALVEAGSYPVKLGPTLGDQQYDAFGGTLLGSYTAHPHLDPLTGENHAICYSAHNPGEVRHVVVDAHGKVTRELAIPVEHGPMIHDCAITARYVVILDLPVTFSLPAAMAGEPFPYRWNPQHRARVGLLPRNGAAADVIWCDVEPCSVFHVANAYDRADGAVIMDVCAYGTMFGPEAVGPDGAARGLERWTIDPVTGTVAITTIDSTPQEFPRPDERRFGQPYRYAYAMAVPTDPAAEFIGDTRLFRHDLVEGTRQVHDFGPRRHPGEFVFVPASEDAVEGEGWLVGFVVDMANDTTDFVVLDAMRFEDPPVGVVHLPHRVPAGFHGNWVPG